MESMFGVCHPPSSRFLGADLPSSGDDWKKAKTQAEVSHDVLDQVESPFHANSVSITCLKSESR